MPIDEWWPKLQPRTRDWLIANNGDVVPGEIAEEIAGAGGPPVSSDWWVYEEDGGGPCMPDDAVDWIEEVANADPSEGGRDRV